MNRRLTDRKAFWTLKNGIANEWHLVQSSETSAVLKEVE